MLPAGLKGLNNAGPHGLSEILYAFTSTAANNGSAFAGLTGDDLLLQHDARRHMLIGRFAMIVPMLALAGFLAEKKIAPESAGTFPVTTPLFVVLLVGVILIVGALTFFPALALGPIVEHLLDERREALLTWLSPEASALRSADRPARDRAMRSSSSHPRHMVRNPVMFVVLVGSVLTTLVLVRDVVSGARRRRLHAADRALALVHRALRELRRGDGGGARQGAGGHAARSRARRRTAKRLRRSPAAIDRSTRSCRADAAPRRPRALPARRRDPGRRRGRRRRRVGRRVGDHRRVRARHPRDRGGDRSAVTGGTKVLSDYLVIRITANPGETFLDRMIALVEGASRQKTPNEIALTILLSGLTIIFLFAVVDAAAVRDLQRRRGERSRC